VTLAGFVFSIWSVLMYSTDATAQHTGLLDLKEMARVATGVMILRKGNSPDWSKDLDTQMTNWSKTYITWMQTNPLGVAELASEK
jgi:hypothetical protein